MGGFQQVDVARNQFDSKGLELAIQSMTQNLNNFYSTGTINEIGAIVAYGGTLPPTGFLLCDGTAISRATFSALFAVLGTTYGAGDGSTTFNLPNLKGRVPVGLDTSQTEFDTMGETGGAKQHSHPLSSNGQAKVTFSGGNPSIWGAYVPSSSWTPDININTSAQYGGGSTRTNGVSLMGNTDNQVALQPYQVVNYIIRYALPLTDSLQKLPSIPYKFRAYRSIAMSSINGTIKVFLDQKNYDTGNNYDNATNGRFVAPVSGWYQFNACVGNSATASTVWQAMLYKNGGTLASGTLMNVNSAYQYSVVADCVYLNAGDYVELMIYASAVAGLTVGSNNTFMSGYLVSV